MIQIKNWTFGWLIILVSLWNVLRKRFDDEVEAEPEAPTVVIKGDRENQRQHKQQHQHTFISRADNQQEKEAHQQDYELGRDDVGEDRADKKPVLTLEQREAAWAVMPDVKRSRDDSGLATGGTT